MGTASHRYFIIASILITASSVSAQRMEWLARTSANSSNLRTFMAADQAGNSFLAGEFSGTIHVGDSTFYASGAEDVVLVKFDPSGGLLWAEQFGSEGDATLQALATDTEGNVFMGIHPSGAGTQFMAYDTIVTLTSTGPRDMVIKVTPSGAVARVHLSRGCRFDVAGTDVYKVYSPTLGTFALEQLDGDLQTIWQQPLGNLSFGYFSIDATPAGYVALAATEVVQDSMSLQGITVPNDPTDLNEMIVVRMDLDGNAQWIRTCGASNNVLERPEGIAVGDDGRVYIATHSDTAFTFAGGGFPSLPDYDGRVGFLLAYTAAGDEDWAIPAYSHFDQVTFWDVIVDDDGNVVSSADMLDGGLVNGLPVPATQRPFGLLKTDPDGNTIWLKHPVEEATYMNCPAFDLGQSADGAYYLGGFGQTFALDCIPLQVTGGYNYYVMRIVEEPWIAPDATFTWNADGLDVQFTDASSDAENWSWVFGDAGTSTDPSPFHSYPGNGTYYVTQTVGYGICTDQFTDTLELISTSVNAGSDPDGFVVRTGEGLLQIVAPSGRALHITCFDAQGRLVLQRKLSNAGSEQFALPAGSYVLRLSDENEVRTMKVVVP